MTTTATTVAIIINKNWLLWQYIVTKITTITTVTITIVIALIIQKIKITTISVTTTTNNIITY